MTYALWGFSTASPDWSPKRIRPWLSGEDPEADPPRYLCPFCREIVQQWPERAANAGIACLGHGQHTVYEPPVAL